MFLAAARRWLRRSDGTVARRATGSELERGRMTLPSTSAYGSSAVQSQAPWVEASQVRREANLGRPDLFGGVLTRRSIVEVDLFTSSRITCIDRVKGRSGWVLEVDNRRGGAEHAAHEVGR